jgi:hypothetical protein
MFWGLTRHRQKVDIHERAKVWSLDAKEVIQSLKPIDFTVTAIRILLRVVLHGQDMLLFVSKREADN